MLYQGAARLEYFTHSPSSIIPKSAQLELDGEALMRL